MAFSESTQSNSSKLKEDIAKFKEQYLKSINLQSDEEKPSLLSSDFLKSRSQERQRSRSSASVLSDYDGDFSCKSTWSRRESYPSTTTSPQVFDSRNSENTPGFDLDVQKRTFSPPIRLSSFENEIPSLDSAIGDMVSPTEGETRDFQSHRQVSSTQDVFNQWKLRNDSGQDLQSPADRAREKLKEDYIKSLGLKERPSPLESLPKLKDRKTTLQHRMALDSSPKQTKMQRAHTFDVWDERYPPLADGFQTQLAAETKNKHQLHLEIPTTATFHHTASPDSDVAELNSPSSWNLSKSPSLPSKSSQSIIEKLTSFDALDTLHKEDIAEEGKHSSFRSKIPPPVSPKPSWLRTKALLNKAPDTATAQTIETSNIHNDSTPYVSSNVYREDEADSSEEKCLRFNVKSMAARYSKSIEDIGRPQTEQKKVMTTPHNQYNDPSSSKELELLGNSSVKNIVKTFETDKQAVPFSKRTGSHSSIPSLHEDTELSIIFGDSTSKNTDHNLIIDQKPLKENSDDKISHKYTALQDRSLSHVEPTNLLADPSLVLENLEIKKDSFSDDSASKLPSKHSTLLLKQALSQKAVNTFKTDIKDTISPSKLSESVLKRFDYTESLMDKSEKCQVCQRVTKKELTKNRESAVLLGAQRFEKMIETNDKKQENSRLADKRQTVGQAVDEDLEKITVPDESWDVRALASSNQDYIGHASNKNTKSDNLNRDKQMVAKQALESINDQTESKKSYSAQTYSSSSKYSIDNAASNSKSPYAKHKLEQAIARFNETEAPEMKTPLGAETLAESATFTSNAYGLSHLGNAISAPVSKTPELKDEKGRLGENTYTLNEIVLAESDNVSPLSGSEIDTFSDQVVKNSFRSLEEGCSENSESLPRKSSLIVDNSSVSTVDIKTVPPKAFYYLCDPNSESTSVFINEERQDSACTDNQLPSSMKRSESRTQFGDSNSSKNETVSSGDSVLIELDCGDSNSNISTSTSGLNDGDVPDSSICTDKFLISGETATSNSNESLRTNSEYSDISRCLDMDVKDIKKEEDIPTPITVLKMYPSSSEGTKDITSCSEYQTMLSKTFQEVETSVFNDSIDGTSFLHDISPDFIHTCSGLIQEAEIITQKMSTPMHSEAKGTNEEIEKLIEAAKEKQCFGKIPSLTGDVVICNEKEILTSKLDEENQSSKPDEENQSRENEKSHSSTQNKIIEYKHSNMTERGDNISFDNAVIEIGKPKTNLQRELDLKDKDFCLEEIKISNNIHLLDLEHEDCDESSVLPKGIREDGNQTVDLQNEALTVSLENSDSKPCEEKNISYNLKEHLSSSYSNTSKLQSRNDVDIPGNVSRENNAPERNISDTSPATNTSYSEKALGFESSSSDSRSFSHEPHVETLTLYNQNLQYPPTTDPEDGLQETRPLLFYNRRAFNSHSQPFSNETPEIYEHSSENRDHLQIDDIKFQACDSENMNTSDFTLSKDANLFFLDSPLEDATETKFPFIISDSYSDASSSFNSLLSGLTRRSSDSSFHSATDFAGVVAEGGEYTPTQSSSCDISDGESLYGSAIFTPSLSQATSAEISTTELWAKLWELDSAKSSENFGESSASARQSESGTPDLKQQSVEKDRAIFDGQSTSSDTYNSLFAIDHSSLISDEEEELRSVEVDSLDGYELNDDEFFEECLGDFTKQTPEMVRSLSWDELKSARLTSEESSKPNHIEDAFSQSSHMDSMWGSPRLARFVTLDSLQVEDLQEPDHSLLDTFTHAETIEELDEEVEEEEEEYEEDSSASFRRKSGHQVAEFSRLSIILEEEAEESKEMWSSAISDFGDLDTDLYKASPLYNPREETCPGVSFNAESLEPSTVSSLPPSLNASGQRQDSVGTTIKSGMCWVIDSACRYSSTESLEGSSISADDDCNENFVDETDTNREHPVDAQRYSSASSSTSSSPYGSMERDSLDGTYENLAALSERLLWEEQKLNSAVAERTEATGIDSRSATEKPLATAPGPLVEPVTPSTHTLSGDQESSANTPDFQKSNDADATGDLIPSTSTGLSQTLTPAEQIPATVPSEPSTHYAHSQDNQSTSLSNKDSSISSSRSQNSIVVPTASETSTPSSLTCPSANFAPDSSLNESPLASTFSESSCISADNRDLCGLYELELSLIENQQQIKTDCTVLARAEGEIESVPDSTQQSDSLSKSIVQNNPQPQEPHSESVVPIAAEESSCCIATIENTAFAIGTISSSLQSDTGTGSQIDVIGIAASQELEGGTVHTGMDEDGKSSNTKSNTTPQSQIPLKAPLLKSLSASSETTLSSKTKTAAISSSSYESSEHSTNQVSIKSGKTMMSSEDPGPVRRKSLDLGKSSNSKSEVSGRRRHNTDMDDMVEQLMRGVEDEEDPLLDETASSSLSSDPSSSESSPSQTSMQRIASASSLKRSTASDPYKVLERSQSDASLMRDLILLDPEEVHLTAAESSSGQNISECNRVYLDLSRAEVFEKVEHNDVACSIMRTSSGRHLETIPQDEELKTEDLSYIYNTSRSFSQESSSEDLSSSKSKMKDSSSRTKGGSGQSSQDGGNCIGPKSNLRSSFQIYSHSLKQKLRQLQMGSVPEQVNAITELNVLMEQAWSMPVYGKDLAYELCDILRTESALDLIVANLASPNRELMKVSARLLEQSLTTSNRRQVANNGLERVVKMTCECRGDCELAQTTTGILESLFKTSEDTCASVIKLGGLEVITYWCRCNDRVTLKNCAIALSNLALYGGSDNQQEMAKYKVPEWLFPLAFVEDDSVRYYALLAIGVLVSNKEIESAVMSSGTLALVLPFVDTHDPAEFAQGDMSHRHGRSPGWLKRLIPVLSSRREEAQALAAFHFVMEAGIKSEQGRIEVLYDIGAVEPLKWLASTPNRVASKLAGQALKIIGEEIPHKLSQQVPLWTPSDVAHWTAQVGFGAYTERFETCQVDGDLLLRLTDQELKESIDMACSITRKRFLRELRDLKISCDYTSCDPSMLGAWLRGDVGEEMAQYTYQMLNTGIDRPLLPSVTDEHLTSDCSINNGIHRMKILSRIEELRTMARSHSSVLYDSPDGAGPASISGYRAPIDCFISYRRSNGSQLASLLKVHLQLRGFTVFIDIERLRAGKFDESLLESVRQARNFIIVLTANSLDRCMGDEERKDWVHKEITAAIESGVNIIPLIDNFRWPSPETLPEDMRNVCYFNHIRWIHDYQDACVDKLERFIRGETNPLKFCSPAVGGASNTTSSIHGAGVAVRNESVSSPISTAPTPPPTSSSSSTSAPSESLSASSSNTRVLSSSSSKTTPNTNVTTTTTAFAGPNSPPYRRAQSLAAAHSVDIDDSPTTPTS